VRHAPPQQARSDRLRERGLHRYGA
jgi:hypothetical protein